MADLDSLFCCHASLLPPSFVYRHHGCQNPRCKSPPYCTPVNKLVFTGLRVWVQSQYHAMFRGQSQIEPCWLPSHINDLPIIRGSNLGELKGTRQLLGNWLICKIHMLLIYMCKVPLAQFSRMHISPKKVTKQLQKEDTTAFQALHSITCAQVAVLYQQIIHMYVLIKCVILHFYLHT